MVKEQVKKELLRIENALTDANHNIRNATANIYGLTKNRNEIVIKNIEVFTSILVKWHPTLVKIFFWVCNKYPGEVVITCGYRPKGTGIHSILPLPALDLRSRTFITPENVEQDINTNWKYNHPTKLHLQVCLYHRSAKCKYCGNKFDVDPKIGVLSSTTCPKCKASKEYLIDRGPHFHLQVRNETKEV